MSRVTNISASTLAISLAILNFSAVNKHQVLHNGSKWSNIFRPGQRDLFLGVGSYVIAHSFAISLDSRCRLDKYLRDTLST